MSATACGSVRSFSLTLCDTILKVFGIRCNGWFRASAREDRGELIIAKLRFPFGTRHRSSPRLLGCRGGVESCFGHLQ